MKGNRHQTQWSGQFGVAHEMTRRGYLVSFTMGNAPRTDLICTSPNGHPFEVQVKSLKARNYFIFQKSLFTPKDRLTMKVCQPKNRQRKTIAKLKDIVFSGFMLIVA